LNPFGRSGYTTGRWPNGSAVDVEGPAVRPIPCRSDAITTAPRAWAITTKPLPQQEQDEDYPWRYSRPGNWGVFRAGLFCTFWAVVAAMLLVVLLAVLLAPGNRGERTERILWQVSLGVGLLTSALTLIGCLLCCMIPREAGAKGWPVTFGVSLVSPVAILCFACLSSLVLFVLHSHRLVSLVLALGLLAVWADLLLCHFSFLSLLRAAARYWGEDGLARSFLRYFFVTVAKSVAAVALFFAGDFGRRHFPEWVELVGAAGGAALALALLGQFAWCLVLLRRLRKLIW
jgi:hypothetical protein